jgi:hypothetical protein
MLKKLRLTFMLLLITPSIVLSSSNALSQERQGYIEFQSVNCRGMDEKIIIVYKPECHADASQKKCTFSDKHRTPNLALRNGKMYFSVYLFEYLGGPRSVGGVAIDLKDNTYPDFDKDVRISNGFLPSCQVSIADAWHSPDGKQWGFTFTVGQP